jgi:sugar lactone lactonase YvrE
MPRRRTSLMRISATVTCTVVLAVVLSGGTAWASVPIATVVAFNASTGEFPEGVAVDHTGNVYVSLIEPVGDVVKFTPDGSRSVLAHFAAANFGPLGLATDASGNVYVADATFDPSTAGVYRVTPDGTSTRLSGTGPMQFPNGVALDRRGNVYATDSATGAVWRIPPGGSGEIWFDSPLLEGTGELLGIPIGANGIAFRNGQILVANTEGAKLVSIPVLPDGSAGSPTVMAEGPNLFGSDGIALGVLGDVFVAVNPQNTLVRVAANGSVTTLASAADGLENPASLAFGTGRGDRKSLYVTNFAVFTSSAHPALLKVGVGEPGVPLP